MTWANRVVVTPGTGDICITDTHETRRACRILIIKKAVGYKYVSITIPTPKQARTTWESQSTFPPHDFWLRNVRYTLFCYELRRPDPAFGSQQLHGQSGNFRNTMNPKLNYLIYNSRPIIPIPNRKTPAHDLPIPTTIHFNIILLIYPYVFLLGCFLQVSPPMHNPP